MLNQRPVDAGRYNGAVVYHKDLVGVLNGSQPVGDDQQGLATGQRCDAALKLVLVFRIGKGCGLVQNHNGGVFQHHPGNGDALLFTAGQGNHYVDRSQWHITENVHEPIISCSDFETVQRILENAPVKRPNGDGEIHPLSGLLFCKDCGAKMHIRIDYRNGGKRHVAYCSEYHKGKAKNPKCHSPHIMDADLLMQTIAEVLKKIEDYSISNRAEFEALVKKNLAMQQTDQTKKQQKRIPQITTRLEQIDKVLNKLYEDNALGTIPQDRYEQMSQKYSEEYYSLKAELEQLREQLSAYENAGGRAQKFLKLTERHAAFTDLTSAILNEFISRIEVHERDQKRARYAIQHISIYFNYIGKFENEVTQLAEPTEQEIRQMREEIEEAKKEKSRAYHRQYSREYRARNLEKQREYDRIKAREYRARRKAQAAAAQSTQ